MTSCRLVLQIMLAVFVACGPTSPPAIPAPSLPIIDIDADETSCSVLLADVEAAESCVTPAQRPAWRAWRRWMQAGLSVAPPTQPDALASDLRQACARARAVIGPCLQK